MPAQNKFTRSIMERLEQEQQKERERQQEEKTASKALKTEPTVAVAPPESRENIVKDATEKQPVIRKKEPAKAKKTSPPAVKEEENTTTSKEGEEPSAIPDLSQFITPKAERVAKNKTFYLDQEVIDALHQAAKSQKMTDSRLCNEILRGVLGLS